MMETEQSVFGQKQQQQQQAPQPGSVLSLKLMREFDSYTDVEIFII